MSETKRIERFEPLSAGEVIKAIEFGSPSRIPMVLTHWWGEGLHGQHGDRLNQLWKYPQDAVIVPLPVPGATPSPDGFFWKLPPRQDQGGVTAYDSNVLLPDWSYLEDMIAAPPDFSAPGLLDNAKRIAERAHAEGKYVLLHHWGLFFERIWGFRGMSNLFMDYILNPEEIHKLHSLVADVEVGLLERAIREIQPHGYFHSDDLGSQRSLMMSPQHFREFIKPYYSRVWSCCRQKGVHVWLHTCGCVTDIIGDLIESGLNVLHPIQKYTMDEKQIAEQWNGKIAVWAGLDVQDTIQRATPEGVRKEVRFLIDTFDTPKGGMLLAAGNGIVSGTPFENIEAFLDECYTYGSTHRSSFSK